MWSSRVIVAGSDITVGVLSWSRMFEGGLGLDDLGAER